MELPITRPSMMCYADEVKFPDLLNDLSSNRHNGFIRITAGSEEGFILFKEGKEIAASYIRYSRVDAIEKIKFAMEDNTTLIEVFEVRSNQIDFFMDMNKPYLIGSDAYDLIDKYKKPEVEIKEPIPKAVPKPKPVPDTIPKKSNSESVAEKVEKQAVSKAKENIVPSQDNTTVETEKLSETETVKQTENENTVKEDVPEIKKIEPIKEQILEEVSTTEKIAETESVNKTVPEIVKSEPEIVVEEAEVSNEKPSMDILNLPESSEKDIESLSKEDSPKPSMDRSELMKKYGIKDIQDEDVTNILESYKGGSVSDEDVEKIELTLMNKIKKSTLSIPKIRGAEIMVFLDNAERLTGKVNIIIESETQGFLSRIMGDSNKANLERQIIEISQIEIRKSFRKYPEIVDDFNINVEIS
jgi:Uncharacterized protein conserved in archaea (DUF2226)